MMKTYTSTISATPSIKLLYSSSEMLVGAASKPFIGTHPCSCDCLRLASDRDVGHPAKDGAAGSFRRRSLVIWDSKEADRVLQLRVLLPCLA